MKTMNSENPVDVVITWVDGNDPEWLAEKNEHLPEKQKINLSAASDSRFRDWDNLQYIFRGIEKFMPWVRKIFLITWGHLPKWINTDNEKLVIVNHKDYIPEQYRPTFNSNVIELNMHRIKDLSEDFVYFNDDTFVVGPTKKSDFFVNGVPKTEAFLNPHAIRPDGIACTVTRDLEILNKYFTTADIRKHKRKWFSGKSGKYRILTWGFMHYSSILGIYEPHTPLSLKKSTIAKLWELEPETFESTSANRFRKKDDINIFLVRHWQMMEGNFEPRNPAFSKKYFLPEGLDHAVAKLKNPGACRLLCINDSSTADSITDFEHLKSIVNKALDELLPEKSSFEK